MRVGSEGEHRSDVGENHRIEMFLTYKEHNVRRGQVLKHILSLVLFISKKRTIINWQQKYQNQIYLFNIIISKIDIVNSPSILQ